MAVHELLFTNFPRLKNNNMRIKLDYSNLRANEKMRFRNNIGRLKKAIDEESQKKSLETYPYADKDGRVAALAKKIKRAKKGLDAQLFGLISTCTPIQYQNSAMAEAAVGYRFVFDTNSLFRYPPRLMTPGELLSSPTVEYNGMELIPVAKTSELQALCAAVLREWGFQAYFSFINEYAHKLKWDVKTTNTAISVITNQRGMYDFWITAPTLWKLKDKAISGVRILDDISFLSYLYIMAAENAAGVIDDIITRAMSRMLDELGHGKTAKAILANEPFPSSAGISAAIKMQGLLDRNIGEDILGKDAYERLTGMFDEWEKRECNETKKIESMLIEIENALANAMMLEKDNSFAKSEVMFILISLTPGQQRSLLENMGRRGYDSFLSWLG